MKKAINLTLLVIYVLIALFVCNQTVVASNGLFLANNNSNAAQDFINATKIASTTEKENELASQPLTIIEEGKKNEALLASSTSEPATKSSYVNDEGSLPLFTNRTASASPTLPLTSTTSSLSATFSLIVSLLGIIILALAASWFIQKKTGIISNDFGKVLGVVPLDNKRLIYVVDVMGKMIVLGVTESNINFLTEITDKDTIDAYRLKYGQSVTPGLDKLFPFLRKRKDNNESENLSEEESKLIEERKAENIKNTLDKNHENRLNRLKEMIIKKQ
ncbi:MAG: flagellar biosynthetic protein FliO [Candidatus Riflebacteria bacterium]|nr:flagellar biosynthetic protein FliO [Candidatus Riflebacteria bacterium]